MWLPIALKTVMRAASGKMFFAPCLGTDLFLERPQIRKKPLERVLFAVRPHAA
jgi:hypothetical protein